MGSKVEYVDSSQMYATAYARNSRAIGVLWAVFSACYAVVAAAALATPEWAGADAPAGRVGLWAACVAGAGADGAPHQEACEGRIGDFAAVPAVALQAAAAFVAAAAAAAALAVLAMVMFFFCRSTRVFHVCAWMQLLSAMCMIAGCVTFPASWSSEAVRKVCGPEAAQYSLGRCGVRWAYLLAAVGCLDAVILAALAFILATRHVKLQPDPHYAAASLFKGEMNSAFMGDTGSVAGSRKSLSIHPVLLMPPGQDDTYSQFSQRTVPRSLHSGHYSHPHSLRRNFQL